MSPQDPLGPFDAFRARRADEQAANGLFREQYESGHTAVLPPESGDPAGRFGASQGPYGAASAPPPGIAYAQVASAGRGAARGRGRLRSAVVLGAGAVLVVGVSVGVFAATRSSGGQSAGASPAVAASATPSAGSSNAAKSARATTARLTVTAVDGGSFTATTAGGASVSVRIASTTKFGTAARPFTRAQLVPGAVVYARLRRETDGTVVATVIAAATADNGSAAATASARA